MAYPIEMLDSLRKLEITRNERPRADFPKLSFDEKTKLLEMYHPDFHLKSTS